MGSVRRAIRRSRLAVARADRHHPPAGGERALCKRRDGVVSSPMRGHEVRPRTTARSVARPGAGPRRLLGGGVRRARRPPKARRREGAGGPVRLRRHARTDDRGPGRALHRTGRASLGTAEVISLLPTKKRRTVSGPSVLSASSVAKRVRLLATEDAEDAEER